MIAKSAMTLLAAVLLMKADGCNAEVRIVNDPGGWIGDYVARFERLRAAGDTIIIDGYCADASLSLLPFYHFTSEKLEELQKPVALVDTNKIKLVLTERAKDRFKRSRAAKIADAMQNLPESRFCDRRQLDQRSLTKSE
jgi:hypothetical protein